MESKIVIYQVLPRLFSNMTADCVPNGTLARNGVGKMNDFTPKVLREIKQLGVTHVWYTGLLEHATKTDYTAYGIRRDNPYVVKGEAGSPYAVKDYYDIDPDLAVDVTRRKEEFEELLARTHDAGLKVLMDFIPNQVARQYHSDAKPEYVSDLGEHDDKEKFFSPQNNFYYIPRQLFSPHVYLGEGEDAYYEFPAKVTGNDCFHAYPGENDWYETVKLNYGVDFFGGISCHFDPVPDTWHKMLEILLYWSEKGVDGFRCDMAHMVPVEFWNWAITRVKERFPQVIFIAEIYDQALYRSYIQVGKFDYLYDKVGLYDKLRSVVCHNVSAAQITYCWQAVDGINDKMLYFLENHDEQRIASRQFAGDPFKAIPALIVSATMHTGPLMIYFGQELGEPAADAEGFSGLDGRTTIFDYWSVPTVRQWYNGGTCSVARLSPAQKTLRNTYKKILTVVNREPAIARGGFFDLMYVNCDTPLFAPHTQYAYLRYDGDDLLLIVVNFDNKPATVGVNIPRHAFDHIGIEPGMREWKELLAGYNISKELSPEKPFVCDVPAWGAAILKTTVKKSSQKRNKK